MADRPMNLRHCSRIGLSIALVAAAVCGWAGCQSVNPLPGFGLGKTSPPENQVRKLMNWNSGRVEVYKDFRTVFTERAVYISDEIRSLAVDWEAKSRLLSPDEKEDLFEKTFRGNRDVVQILLGFYTPNEDLNDLDRESSSWIPYLENSDGTVTRAVCNRIEGDEANIYMRFLEWDLSWSRLYLLCFPKGSGVYLHEDSWLNFVISGSTGQGKIRLRAAGSPP